MHPQLQRRIGVFDCPYPDTAAIRKRLVVTMVLLMLTACASDTAYQSPIENREVLQTPQATAVEQQDQATPLDDRQIKIERAEHYQRLAQQSDQRQQIDSILSASEYYIQGNDFYRAESIIAELPQQALEAVQHDRYDVIQAYIAYSRGQFAVALRQLSRLLEIAPQESNSNQSEARYKPYQRQQTNLSRQQVDALLLSSFCYQQLGDFDAAVDALIKREAGLVGAARAETTRYTWQIINSLSPERRQLIIDSTANTLVRNRLEQSLAGEVGEFERAPQQFTQWREDQSTPVKTTIEDEWAYGAPTQIAVLLPLSSKFNKASQALLDGINYQAEQTLSANRPLLRVYDIGENPYQAPQYYAAAVQAGAEIVVGPLGKEFANQVNSSTGGIVPTILLGGDQALNNNTVRLTMSPELEGESVADKALRDGHLTAAILAPESNNGQRTVSAFTTRWLAGGGKISRVVSYSPKQYDHSVELKQLFDINQSEYRHTQLSNALGLTPKFAAYQRSDIDFIFMVANNETGRIVRPQINFFSGSRLPVYATSAVFNGIQDRVNNMDLDRTQFPAMPWVLKSNEVASYAGQLNQLFALGGDAYRLAGSIQQLRSNSALAINGNTGQLSIDSYGEVHQEPVWAEFRDGEAVATQSLGMDLSPIEGSYQGRPEPSNKQGVYNDQNWDTRNSRRKTGD